MVQFFNRGRIASVAFDNRNVNAKLCSELFGLLLLTKMGYNNLKAIGV